MVSDVASHLPPACRKASLEASLAKTGGIVPPHGQNVSETPHGVSKEGGVRVFSETQQTTAGKMRWLGLQTKSDNGWIGFLDFTDSTMLMNAIRVCQDALTRFYSDKAK